MQICICVCIKQIYRSPHKLHIAEKQPSPTICTISIIFIQALYFHTLLPCVIIFLNSTKTDTVQEKPE